MYVRIKCIGKRLGPKDNIVSKNHTYMNDIMKLVNFQ
jgi:hypothetical protein